MEDIIIMYDINLTYNLTDSVILCTNRLIPGILRTNRLIPVILRTSRLIPVILRTSRLIPVIFCWSALRHSPSKRKPAGGKRVHTVSESETLSEPQRSEGRDARSRNISFTDRDTLPSGNTDCPPESSSHFTWYRNHEILYK